MTTTVPSPVYFTLDPTATYSRRRIGWFPAADGADRLGTLRVVLELDGRSKDACEVDCYAVDEVKPRLSQVRTFLLVNETDADQPDAYEVTAVSGVVVKCTCKAARCNTPCKHAAALERLMAEGQL